MRYLNQILKTKKTVFRSNELGIILNITNKNTLKNILQRIRKSWILIYHWAHIRSLEEYDKYELASKIRQKSYISFETILQKEGVIFQDYSNTITMASDNSLSKKIDNINYIYHKLTNPILTNPIGIINHNNKYMIASKERAACDIIYLSKNIYFDNIHSLDIEILEELKDTYNKSTSLLIKKLIKNVRSENT